MNSKTSRVSRGKLLESLRTDNEKDERKKIFQKEKQKVSNNYFVSHLD